MEQKGPDKREVCVKPETKEKLIKRGWVDESKTKILSVQIDVSTNPVYAQAITDSANEFALDFYKEESKNNENENIFFSSPSIYGAFSILHEGARGDTAEEMQNVFGFPEDDDARRVGFYSYMDALNQRNDDDENTILMANALWLANDFAPLPEYVKTAKTYYSSSVDSVKLCHR